MSKFITNYSVTNAAVNDNQEFVGLLKKNDGLLYGDCGYVGKKFVEQFPEGVTSMIHKKAEKNRPLTEAQKASNREKSRIRCRIEHIFGYMTGAMHGITVRSIGLARANFNIGRFYPQFCVNTQTVQNDRSKNVGRAADFSLSAWLHLRVCF